MRRLRARRLALLEGAQLTLELTKLMRELLVLCARLHERRFEIAHLAPLLGELFGHGGGLGAHLLRG